MIDGVVNGIAQPPRKRATRVRHVQSGNTRSYAVWVVIGAVGFAGRCAAARDGAPDVTLSALGPDFSPAAERAGAFPAAGTITSGFAASLWPSPSSSSSSRSSLSRVRHGLSGYPFDEYDNWIGTGHSLSSRHRRHQSVPRHPDYIPHADLRSLLLGIINDRVKDFFVAMLLIESAIIGVFVSLDLFLFFLFWEVTLIPMAFIIGIWGHDRRIYAAIKFVLYTMFGSILMLVGIIWLYNLTGTFDLQEIRKLSRKAACSRCPRNRTAALPRLLRRVCHQGAALPATHLAARRARRSANRRLRHSRGRAPQAGHLRHDPFLPAALSQRRAPWLRALGCWRSSASFTARWFPRFSRTETARRLHLRQPPRLRRARPFRFTPSPMQGAVYQMLNHGISTGALFLRRHALRSPPDPRNQSSSAASRRRCRSWWPSSSSSASRRWRCRR